MTRIGRIRRIRSANIRSIRVSILSGINGFQTLDESPWPTMKSTFVETIFKTNPLNVPAVFFYKQDTAYRHPLLTYHRSLVITMPFLLTFSLTKPTAHDGK